MDDLDLNIGSEVLCEEESCGRLAKVVVDPHTRRVTGLVVEKGLLLKKDSVVPINIVREATEDNVRLNISREKLGDLPPYHDRDYAVVADKPGQPGLEAEDMLEIMALAETFPEPMVPVLQYRVKKGDWADEAAIARGYEVVAADGRIGTVDHVLVDRASGEIRLLVVRRGVFADAVIVPVALVSEVSSERITLNLKRAELDSLRVYMPRDAADILVELKERLAAAIGDPDAVKLDLEGGILRVSGIVPDVRTKRRVEIVARTVEGILDVKNELDTNTGIHARVSAALQTDPCTDLEEITVTVRRGVVTLKGQVDGPAIKDVATDIAAGQKGVVQVINELQVTGDEESACLRYRYIPLPEHR